MGDRILITFRLEIISLLRSQFEKEFFFSEVHSLLLFKMLKASHKFVPRWWDAHIFDGGDNFRRGCCV